MTAIALGIHGASAAGGGRGAEIELVTHSFAGSIIIDPKSPVSAIGRFTLQSDGNVAEATQNGAPGPALVSGEWHRDEPAANLGDDWDVRATLTGGSTPDTNAGLGTWLRLDVSRTWGNTRTDAEGPGTDTSTLTLDFRLNGETDILATVTGMVISGTQTV